MEYVANPHSKNMVRYGRLRPNVMVLSGDLTGSTEIAEFKQELPEQFVSMGMAEQNMLSWAGGMAREGYIPFLHTFAVFLYRRPYDQLSMSVAYPNLKVRLIGFLPGDMTIFETGDATDVETVLDATDDINGPVYIRMLRGNLPRLFPANEPFVFNSARLLSEGDDITLLSSGICTEEAMRAVKVLNEKGVSVKHLHISTLKPFTDSKVLKALEESKQVVTVENHQIIGGLGTVVADMIAEYGLGVKLTKIGIPDTYAQGASKDYLMNKFGLNTKGIVKVIEKILGKDLHVTEEDIAKLTIEPVKEIIKDVRLDAM